MREAHGVALGIMDLHEVATWIRVLLFDDLGVPDPIGRKFWKGRSASNSKRVTQIPVHG